MVGQYHIPVCFDRKEFLHPHDFGDGWMLTEWLTRGNGVAAGLGILLAASNGRGDGDIGAAATERVPTGFTSGEHYAQALLKHVVGRWAGQHVAVLGDYMEDDDVPGFTEKLAWTDVLKQARGWVNISCPVIDAMELDDKIRSARNTPVEAKGAMGDWVRAELYPGFKSKHRARLTPDGKIRKG